MDTFRTTLVPLSSISTNKSNLLHASNTTSHRTLSEMVAASSHPYRITFASLAKSWEDIPLSSAAVVRAIPLRRSPPVCLGPSYPCFRSSVLISSAARSLRDQFLSPTRVHTFFYFIQVDNEARDLVVNSGFPFVAPRWTLSLLTNISPPRSEFRSFELAAWSEIRIWKATVEALLSIPKLQSTCWDLLGEGL